MKVDIKALAEKYESYVVERRCWLHAHPDLSWQEYGTTDYIEAELKAMGLEVQRFEGKPGCTAVIKGGKPGKTVALRADIDALPVVEKTGLSFASEKEGVMHACGHDTHAAMLLGAAKVLLEVRDELAGNVKLLFQPSEENCEGAHFMVEQGVLDGVSAAYGQHVMSGLPKGQYNAQVGPRMASGDNFTITVYGASSHGSAPHEGIDAIVVGTAIVMNLQTIASRLTDARDAVVFSIGTLHGGQRWNAVAGKCVLEGTCRTYYSLEKRQEIEKLARRIIDSTAAAYGARAELDYNYTVPAVLNSDAELVDIANKGFADMFGADKLEKFDSLMGSEDFAYYMEKVPGVYAFIGVTDETHTAIQHNDHYDVPQEVFVEGVAAAARFAVDYLAAHAE